MQAQRVRDTAPEIALRRALHGLGLRYRLHRRPIAGLRRTPDIVFGPARVAVDVRGCFWHGCPEHATHPEANADWWAKKLETNRRRDNDTERRFKHAGWQLVVVWEHEDPALAAGRVARVVSSRRRNRN